MLQYYYVVTEAFKKLVMLLCTPFANCCLVLSSNWALYHLAQLISQTTRRWDSPIADSPHRDSGLAPDHRSVHNKDVKFIRIYSLGPRFSVHCPYQRESVLQRVFLKKLYENFVTALETVRYRDVSVLRGSTVIRKNLN